MGQVGGWWVKVRNSSLIILYFLVYFEKGLISPNSLLCDFKKQ